MTTIFRQFAATSPNVFFITARRDWTDRSFCDDLSEAVCGSGPSSWSPSLGYREIEDELLRRDDRVEIVDEGDALLGRKNRYLDCLRVLNDRVGGCLILLSRGNLRQAVTAAQTSELKAVRWRLEREIELPVPSIGDLKLFARELHQVEIADDLAKDIFARLGKSVSIRSLVSELEPLGNAARVEKLSSLNLTAWRRLSGLPEPQKIATRRPLPALPLSESRAAGGGAA
jgi:hypothetical protein